MQLQSSLDILVNWSEKWQRKFNVDKCKVLHIENNNYYINHTMNGSELSKVSHERDLKITISNDHIPGKHYSDVIKTNNKLVGFISGTFGYKSEKYYPYTI